jgi:hypothetical protein
VPHHLRRDAHGSILTAFGFPKPEPVEVEFLGWDCGMARILMPYSEESLGALLAKRAGPPHPPPYERLVPASDVRLIDAEA